MPFVNVPSTNSADYINSQNKDFQDTYYVDNLNTLGGGGGGGGTAQSAFYREAVGNGGTLTPGYVVNLVDVGPPTFGTQSWTADFNDIGVTWDTEPSLSAGIFRNETGAEIELYVTGVVAVDVATSVQFIPQTSADNVTWTNAFSPGSGRSAYSLPASTPISFAATVTVPDDDYFRLSGYNTGAYSAQSFIYTCTMTQI
jgi:hypothetical protein